MKQNLFVLLASNMIKIEINKTIENVVFSMVWKNPSTGAPVMSIYDDTNWVNIEKFTYVHID